MKSTGLRFEAVAGEVWVRRLEKETDAAKTPAVRLLPFFREKYLSEGGVAAEERFERANAYRWSPRLRDAREIDAALVGKFLKYWLSVQEEGRT